MEIEQSIKLAALNANQDELIRHALDLWLKNTGAKNLFLVASTFQALDAAQPPKVETPNADA